MGFFGFAIPLLKLTFGGSLHPHSKPVFTEISFQAFQFFQFLSKFNVYPCPHCLASGSLNLETDVAITQAPHLSNSGPSLGLFCALNHRAQWQACKWSHFSLLFKLMKGNVSFLKCVHEQQFLGIRKKDQRLVREKLCVPHNVNQTHF